MGASCCDANRRKGEEEDLTERVKKKSVMKADPPRHFSDDELFIANEILKQRNKTMMQHLRTTYQICSQAKQSDKKNVYAMARVDEERKCTPRET